jgi:hypothetical protein
MNLMLTWVSPVKGWHGHCARPSHYFRRLISFKVSIAISRSATIRLSGAFSVSKVFRCLTSLVGLQDSEPLAPDVGRLLADLVLARRVGDRTSVGLAQDRNHLLFGESTLSHGLLARGGSHSLKFSVAVNSWAGRIRWYIEAKIEISPNARSPVERRKSPGIALQQIHVLSRTPIS